MHRESYAALSPILNLSRHVIHCNSSIIYYFTFDEITYKNLFQNLFSRQRHTVAQIKHMNNEISEFYNFIYRRKKCKKAQYKFGLCRLGTWQLGYKLHTCKIGGK